MNAEWVRGVCLSLPHTTESVQWGDHLVFKIGGKMFAVTSLEPGGHFMSIKSSPEESAELVEREGIVPAPYLARSHWVALESADTLPAAELKKLLHRAYELVFDKLPKKTKASLGTKAARGRGSSGR
jgi:predicted DNA-binding protein (MmcQ/YjbR family)